MLRRSFITTMFTALLAMSTSRSTIAATSLPVTDALKVHLDAGNINNDNGATNPADGANVALWKTLEGRNLVFDQTGGATVQPTYTASESTINSKPTVTFGGQAGEWLTNGDGTTKIITGTNTTFFIVARFTTDADGWYGMMAGWKNIPYADYVQYEGFCITDTPNATGGIDMKYHGVSMDRAKVSGSAVTDWMLLEVHCDGTNIRVYREGVLMDTQSQSNRVFDFHYLILGARNEGTTFAPNSQHACQIAEVVMYEKALIEEERQTIGYYLQDKYGFTGSYQAQTPVIGLETSIGDDVLSWHASSEAGVKEYQVVNSATGEVIETVEAGAQSYSVKLTENVTVELLVVDKSGYTQTFAIDSEDSVVIDLTIGWNLISTPFAAENIDQLGESTWAWDSANQNYVIAEQAGQQQGLWVYSREAKTLTLTGQTENMPLELTKGWNLAGPSENCEAPEGLIIYGWDTAYKTIGVMSVGRGYWIYTEDALSIMLPE